MPRATTSAETSIEPAHLVLLPGLDGTGELFGPLLDVLGGATETTVVRYESERSFEDYVARAAQALSRQNTVLLAESFSGPIALALCARHSARIRCVVLCATFAQSPFRSLLRAAKFMPAALLGPSPIQPLLLQHLCLNGEPDSLLLERAVSVLRSLPASRMHVRLSTLAAIDAQSLLQRINVPVLYLRAASDRIVSRQLGIALTDRLSNVCIEEIAGPHLLLQSRPRECAEAILRFIATCPAILRHS